MVVALQSVDDALLSMLRAQVDGDAVPLRIGDAKAPEPAPGAVGPEMPYAALYPFSGGQEALDLRDPHVAFELVYQVLCVGYSRQSARWMSDRIRTAVLGRNASSTGYLNAISAAGFGVIRREQVSVGAARLEGTIWNISDEYGLLVRAT